MAATDEPYRALVKVLAWCGLRLGEAFALRRRSVDLDAGVLTVSESLSDANGRLSFEAPKTHQHRTITLDEGLRGVLHQHLLAHVAPGEDALLFTGRTGQPLRAAGFRNADP